MKIKAAVVHEKNGPFVIEEVDLAEPKSDEVLVRVIASGVCHTDEFGRSQGVPIPFPMVLGHEGAGVVEKLGSDVKNFEVGDHVAFSYAYCGHCNTCLAGEPYYCEHYNEINFGGVAPDGTTRLSQNGKPVSMFFGQSSFATHSVVNQRSLVKVDKDVDLTLIAPLGCGIQTGAGSVTNILKPRINESIAVFGIGSVGISAIMAASLARCEYIIAVGGNDKSLELAKELGATHTINRKEVDSVEEAIKKIVPRGTDYVIDTSGHGPMIQTAINSAKYNGTILALGASGVIDSFNVGNDILMNMRTLKGACEGESIAQVYIPELVRMYKEGKFPLDKLVSVYDFEDIEQAFQDSHAGKIMKPVLKIGEL